ncbi:NF-kappa-B inhibitor zeta [Plectropomus leopardus]|uniref:NF-kappa-B inhibitor zeta n=1 Tax=Plectropomus leopardus TaxID=160734 RepID=UPI001C4AA3E0|nr:NF-kappa-B inhibitor zeta [Plectropomus leopardus]
MLDPRWNETRGSQILAKETSMNQCDKDFLNADPRPPEYVQSVHRKTVKELLKMRRRKLNQSQEDNNWVHTFKSAKPEALASDPGPPLSDPQGPQNTFDITSPFLPASPGNGHITPKQMQHPALQGPAAPTAEVMTLFQWQIQKEAQRVGEISSEQLNMQDADGDTCLHIAVAQGRRALAYVLAAKMAQCGSLDMKEHKGQTALQIAAATNHHFIVHDLLTHGAQINTRDLWGRSPLHVCAEKGHFLSLQSIGRTLMGTGTPIDIEMFNYDGFTPLHAAVLSHNAVVKELRSAENLCSFMTKELEQKAQMFVECIQTLLLMGASCETKDLKSGRTCLHVASEEANLELLNIFLERPSSLSEVNVKTFSGNTALHIVSSLPNHKAQVGAVKLLMRKGADPGAKNFENEMPCQLVPEGPLGEKVRLILKGKYLHV